MASSMVDEKRPYPHWHDFVGGGVSGLGARCITAPLDLLKIRRQLQSSSDATASSSRALTGEWNIFQNLYKIAEREGGIRSLFRGNIAASYLWMGYSISQFWVYGYASEYLKDRYSSKDPTIDNERVATVISFTSGAFAGLCATAVTYPPDVACEETFREAEQLARAECRGFWCPTATPIPPTPKSPTFPPPPHLWWPGPGKK